MKSFIIPAIIALLVAPMGLSAAPSSGAAPDVEMIGAAHNAASPSLRAVDGGVELAAAPSEATAFMIYSITGQLVKKVTLSSASRETVELPGGCYIVRCHAWAKKVVVN